MAETVALVIINGVKSLSGGSVSPTRPDELKPIVFANFTKGLYERGNDRECPFDGGLLEAQDCMPLPTGGLRAAWAWREESLGVIPTNQRVIGFQINRGNVDKRELNRIDAWLMLGSTSTAAQGPFTYESWVARGSTSLSNTSTWTTGRSHTPIHYLTPSRNTFFFGDGDLSWYYNIGMTTGASTGVSGIFQMNGTDLSATASTVVSAGVYAFVGVHQNRLMYAQRFPNFITPFTLYRWIEYTGVSTFAVLSTADHLGIAEYERGNICYYDSIYPQDLFVLKQGHGGYSVQGDIGSGPIVRELFRHHVPERPTWGIRTPQGVAYMTEYEGIWIWTGATQELLSYQFVGTPMTTRLLSHGPDLFGGWLGSLGYGGTWLFTPKGYVRDDRGFWFRTNLPGPNVYSHWSYDDIERRIYAAGYVEPGSDLKIISASTDEATMLRSPTFSATLPLIDTAERNVEVRRIEVFGQGFGTGGTWQLQLTNDRGETETTDPASVAARAASARFNTRLQGDWLKVRLLSEGATDASSETGKSEAPMISQIIAWVRPRQTRPTS